MGGPVRAHDVRIVCGQQWCARPCLLCIPRQLCAAGDELMAGAAPAQNTRPEIKASETNLRSWRTVCILSALFSSKSRRVCDLRHSCRKALTCSAVHLAKPVRHKKGSWFWIRLWRLPRSPSRSAQRLPSLAGSARPTRERRLRNKCAAGARFRKRVPAPRLQRHPRLSGHRGKT